MNSAEAMLDEYQWGISGTRIREKLANSMETPIVIGWRRNPFAEPTLQRQLLRRDSRDLDEFECISDFSEALSRQKRAIERTKQEQEEKRRQDFLALADQWRAATEAKSSINEIVLHPAYQRIIGRGPQILPFILKELENQLDHWFWALEAISGVNPVPEDEHGNMKRMTERWLSWGRAQGLL
jgi:hypothetical protein